ncbi:YidC/Oxa1 family membrane protein insertase [Peptoniphilus stercorisuis]|uniref:YidC/Oxa1 family membrane protein insertase n=1 Tax=Peptoniphilus stercorisuis TaxID=1436965 RepID=A0ABS4KCP5_9FIRM|nr:YidC/Oxa1 family membrane protein insertase [Peptoniphilus stercorisuis]MBP2025548.1 YidC/Oxa1 family membrane protein insertase [Peptoniphilus stercorisuis]
MSAISKVLGSFLKLIYDVLVGAFPTEPESISFFALSIIVATIVLKLVIIPLNVSQIKNQKKMAELQPEMQKLQKKYKNDPQTLAAKQQKLYKDANYNMLAGCLPMIIQMVVLIAFYRVFIDPTKYAFTKDAFSAMNKNFFFIKSLEEIDKTMVLPIVAAITTFLVSFVTTKNPANETMQNQQSQGMMNGMMIFMPIMILTMGRRMQSALVLYWTVSNIFTIIQQLISNYVVSKGAEEVK